MLGQLQIPGVLAPKSDYRMGLPQRISDNPNLFKLLHKVVDDIGPIYMPEAHKNANETWWLLLKEKLNHWDRFKLITRYVGNGGNPLILARWLYAYGSLGPNHKDAASILKRISKNALCPADKRSESFQVYQWTHKQLVSVPVTTQNKEDCDLFDLAIQELYGVNGNAAANIEIRNKLQLDDRWRLVSLPNNDMFGVQNKMF